MQTRRAAGVFGTAAILLWGGVAGWAQSGASGTLGADGTPEPAATETPNQAAINVTVNDSAVPFPGQGPIQREGAVLVPLRGVFEKLGASVQYEKSTKTIVAVRGETTVTLRIGDANAFVNGFPRPLSVPAEIFNGATLVPLRFVSESFGGKVQWDPVRHLAQVTTADKSAKPAKPVTAANAAKPLADGATPIAANAAPVAVIEGNGQPATGNREETPKPEAAATPPDAPTPNTQHPTPTIDSVAFEAPAPMLQGGAKIKVTVMGTPGADVTASVPKLFKADVALTEDAGKPGTYTGEFSIPFEVTATDVVVSANLKAGDQTAAPKEATAKFAVDSAGPEVTAIAPDDKAILKNVRPTISAQYADAGAKTDAKGTRLFINEQDVTAKAQITASGFTYTPDADLPVGPVTVSVLAKDEYGNETRKEWAFTVQPPIKPITKIVVAPTGNSLRAGETLTVRLSGAPGGAAKFTLGPLKDLPMSEESEGVYVGTYIAKKGDKLTKAPVAVTITTKDGETATQNAPETVTISAGIPAAPVIDAPIEGAKIGVGYTVVTGRAEPFTKVRITLRYEGKALFGKKTEVLAGAEADVDEKGKWTTEPLLLETPRGIGSITFTIEAVTVAVTGEISPSASVRFKK